MSKCGGTFIRYLFPAVVKGTDGKANPRWVQHAIEHGKEPRTKNGEPWRPVDTLWVMTDRVRWPDTLRRQANGPARQQRFVTLAMRDPCSWYRSYYQYLPNQVLYYAEIKLFFELTQILSLTSEPIVFVSSSSSSKIILTYFSFF